ncbi:MazG-like nucleotide pyrophosphohydrolase [Microbacterium phage Kelcole]|nr:MazG-like nucleotide pyrophosphohydrolase [Microbacterium phage Kelcole]
MANVSENGKALYAELEASTAFNTLARAHARTQLIFDVFYDDEVGEPDQAIEDALTDLMHMAAKRGVDFEEALSGAARMWTKEREEWNVDD